ncbi:hypothetical protein GCM10029992_25240 [Glycomyces albus]
MLSLKQGVNLEAGKNLCGAYSAPSMICCDLSWMVTIPQAELLTGITEMAKNVLAVLPDWEDTFVEALAALPGQPISAFEGLFALGLEAKAPMLEDDPHERHRSLVFEYGHTVGHALEASSAGTMSHGEAVAWGILRPPRPAPSSGTWATPTWRATTSCCQGSNYRRPVPRFDRSSGTRSNRGWNPTTSGATSPARTGRSRWCCFADSASQ